MNLEAKQKEKPLNDNIAAIEMEADLNQARRTSVMAHNVVIRMRELGLPDTLDAELASVSTDLGDLWGAQKEFTDLLHNMLKTSHDWDSIGDSLVDMRSSIDHIAWHLKSIREPITKLAEYAYSQSDK
jgi:beta-xylosidase